MSSLKKYLENRIRGWLPNSHSQTYQHGTTYRFFPTRMAIVAYVALIVGAAAVGGLLGAIGEATGVSSKLGIFWSIVTSMAIGIGGAPIYRRIYRREQQKEAWQRGT